jgi:hypothetical protein
VWDNCKQLPRCLWCGGGHLHRECPEKTNTESTPSCCNRTLVGDKSDLASYRGCSHAKGEEHNELPRDSLGGRSSLSSRHQGSPTQLHCFKTLNTNIHRHCRQMGKACGSPCSNICQFQKNGLSLQAPSSPDSDTLKVATVVRQIMTESSRSLQPVVLIVFSPCTLQLLLCFILVLVKIILLA